jgi:hypothetical protein
MLRGKPYEILLVSLDGRNLGLRLQVDDIARATIKMLELRTTLKQSKKLSVQEYAEMEDAGTEGPRGRGDEAGAAAQTGQADLRTAEVQIRRTGL